MKPGIVISCLALAGCAAHWVKTDATQEQINQDEVSCDEDGRYHAWALRPLEEPDTIDSRGRLVGRGPYIDERRYAYFCMRRKGYEIRYTLG